MEERRKCSQWLRWMEGICRWDANISYRMDPFSSESDLSSEVNGWWRCKVHLTAKGDAIPRRWWTRLEYNKQPKLEEERYLSLSASSHMKEDKMSRDEPSKFTSETFGRQYLADEDSVNDSWIGGQKYRETWKDTWSGCSIDVPLMMPLEQVMRTWEIILV